MSSKWARKGFGFLSQTGVLSLFSGEHFPFCFIAEFSWPTHWVLIHHSGPSARTGSKSDPDQRRSVWGFNLHLLELLHEMVPSRRLRLAGGSARPGFLGPSVSSRSFDSFHGLFYCVARCPIRGSLRLVPFLWLRSSFRFGLVCSPASFSIDASTTCITFSVLFAHWLLGAASSGGFDL